MDLENIPVIDLFAGPGGLGEGFSSVTNKKRQKGFRIALSIEKDRNAHKTLELRSFYRQFENGKIPKEYYSFLRGEIEKDTLFELNREKAIKAKDEAWNITLGVEDEKNIDKRIKEAVSDNANWVLIGGPPCQAYSLVGRARRQLKDGLDITDSRVYLYREYYRILAVHNPPVFVMENVKGILSSKVDDKLFFEQILNDLENPTEAYKELKGDDGLELMCPGYHVFSLVKKPSGHNFDNKPEFNFEDYIIRTEDYGIPQTRHRVILLGIRKDLGISNPRILKKAKQIPVQKVLHGLPKLRSGLTEVHDSGRNWKICLKDIFNNGYSHDLDRDVKSKIKKTIKQIHIPRADRGGSFIKHKVNVGYNKKWFLDNKIKGVCNHSSKAHITDDIYRYLFASCYAKVHSKSPKLENFPECLLPAHKNVKKGVFNDRFRVQVGNIPARTVTCHIAKDGHYYIHPDPKQCRSLTVREAARIQTFPDNYYFCGPVTSQYTQVGNAVPPFLAHQIAKIIFDIFIKMRNNKKRLQQNIKMR
jgi:DNA (cytosine-5)-methyltransferase 1